MNPNNFKFCGSCGYDLQSMPQPTNGNGPADPAAAFQDATSPNAVPPPAVAPPAVAPAAAPPAAPSPAPTAPPRGRLVRINADGSDGAPVPLADGSTAIGRSQAEFADDTFLSPTHATFRFDGPKLFLTDENSVNGVYYRLTPETPVELTDGCIFRIGQEVIRFDRVAPPDPKQTTETQGSPNAGYIGRIALVTGRETTMNAYCVSPEGMHLGRERGDVIFPEDGYVSGLHCRIHAENGKVFLTDLGSSNGTYFRIDKEMELPNGSFVLMGQQIFRAEF